MLNALQDASAILTRACPIRGETSYVFMGMPVIKQSNWHKKIEINKIKRHSFGEIFWIISGILI